MGGEKLELGEAVAVKAFLARGRSSEELKALLQKLAESSDKIKLEFYDFEDKEKAEQYGVERAPAVLLLDGRIRFYGVPKQNEHQSLISALELASRRATDLPEIAKQKLRELKQPMHIEVFTTQLCTFCPKAVRTAYKLAAESENVRADAIDSEEFAKLAEERGVSAVPKIFVNRIVAIVLQVPERKYVEVLLQMIEHILGHAHGHK